MRFSAAIDEALKAREEGKSPTILFNLSGHGHFDMQAYIDYFAGKLIDQDYDAAALEASLAAVAEGGGGVGQQRPERLATAPRPASPSAFLRLVEASAATISETACA